MSQYQLFARTVFALGMVGLGVLALVYGHVGTAWYSIPEWMPWPKAVADASGVILLGCGAGLLFKRTARPSVRILLPYLVIWLLLRIPSVVTQPLVEGNWQNTGELAMIAAGGCVLFARLAEVGDGKKGIRIARMLFIFAMPCFGLSHFVYLDNTVRFVPPWLPFRTGWAYLTGSAFIAAGLGVLFPIYARLAATLVAAMLSVFTLLVWIPEIRATPTSLPMWTEFLISWSITAGAWVVAESIPPVRRLTA